MRDLDTGLHGCSLVEIVGVAGSGKSTLTRQLVETEGERFTRADFIHSSTPSHMPYIARGIPRFAKAFVSGLRRGPRPTWADFKLLAYVTEWDRFVRSNPRYSDRVVLFDQGPMYALVRLKAKGLSMSSTPAFEDWWRERFDAWAKLLTGVVWLDAADELLVDRIEERPQGHALKGASEADSRRFLGIYRTLFSDVLDELRLRGVEVLQFDTAVCNPETIASTVRSRLGVEDAS